MSLMIHTIIPQGIVVSADTRTTINNNGSVRYDDSAEKIIPFPNNIVVSHCGDSIVIGKLTVSQFLYNLRKLYGEKSTITELPLKILNEYKKYGGKGNTTFLVSGYTKDMYIYTYRIETLNSTINLTFSPNIWGATYGGITNIANSIMSNIDYSNLSIKDAIILTKTCINTNITIFNYHKEQSICGTCETYVIDIVHDEIGWLQTDGTIIPDKNISDFKPLSGI